MMEMMPYFEGHYWTSSPNVLCLFIAGTLW